MGGWSRTARSEKLSRAAGGVFSKGEEVLEGEMVESVSVGGKMGKRVNAGETLKYT